MTVEEKRNEIERIAIAVRHHIELELKSYAQKHAVARIEGEIVGGSHKEKTTFWMMCSSDYTNALQDDNEGTLVPKNSALGELFIKNRFGKHVFPSESGSAYTIELLNRAIWTNQGNILEQKDVAEIMFNIDGGDTFMFDRLSDFFKRLDEYRNKQKAGKEEEQAYKEKQEKYRADMQKRSAMLRKFEKREEGHIESDTEAVPSRHFIPRRQSDFGQKRSFVHDKVALRIQNILDPSQEDAKRSHFFDNAVQVIEGGPGTGKTTTMIQRLKFLLDNDAHKYKNALTKEQLDKLMNVEQLDKNWLFIAPSSLLLNYLRSNMINEGLVTNETNSITIDKLRNDLFSTYRLRGAKSSCPLLIMEEDSAEYNLQMITNPLQLLADFERYFVKRIRNKISDFTTLDTTVFSNRNRILRIKSICADTSSISNVRALVRFFANIQKNEGSYYVAAKNDYKSALSITAKRLKDIIWNKYPIIKDEIIDSMYDVEDISEFNEEIEKDLISVFSKMLDASFNAIVSNEHIDDFGEFTPLYIRIKDIYDDMIQVIKGNEHNNATIESSEKPQLDPIIENLMFIRYYHTLFSGIEELVLEEIPLSYIEFRKQCLSNKALYYNDRILELLVVDEGYKTIHKDELDVILGFINKSISEAKKWEEVYGKVKHKFVNAYDRSVKYVIVVDEATDYSILDYYLISSLCNTEFSSLSLCGDIMQGLSANGITDWFDIASVIGKPIEIAELKVSYRQLPNLVNMSKQIYKDDRGVDAPYDSINSESDDDPKPLAFVSSDRREKVVWLAHRIKEIYDKYDEQMPSVAIFVGNNDEAHDLVKQIKDKSLRDLMNGIKVEDCTENRQAEGTNNVRIFNITEVKGMEFEVVK